MPKDWDLQDEDYEQYNQIPDPNLNKVGVKQNQDLNLTIADLPNLNFIKPVTMHILTIYKDIHNNKPIHIELDPGATVSYISNSKVKPPVLKSFQTNKSLSSVMVLLCSLLLERYILPFTETTGL